MAGSPRSTIKTLYRKLQEQYTAEPVCLPTERVLLEHLVFAIFLENSPAEKAFAAFEKLEDYFIDWNEIRVSTKSELADILSDLPFAERAAERLRRTLQWIFDNTYAFDIEEWRKKDIKQFASFLAENPFSTRFMNDFVLNFVLGAPQIPFDEGALRVMRLLELVEIDEENKERVLGIDRTFSPQDAKEFFVLLHQFGTEFMADPIAKSAMKLLKSVDSESVNRTFVSMVETDADRDPAVIARQLAAAQQPRRRKPMIMDMDDVDLDDSMESEFSVETEEDDEEQDRYRRMDEEDDLFNAGKKRDSDDEEEKPKERKSKDKDSVKKKNKPDSEKSSAKKEKKPEKAAREKKAEKKSEPVKGEKGEKGEVKKNPASVKPKKKSENTAKKTAAEGEKGEKGKKGETDKKTGDKQSPLKGGKGKKAPEQAVSRPPDKKKTSGESKSGKKTGDLEKKSSPKKTR